MLILQGLDNSILIENATGKITLTEAEAWDVLEYLHDTVGRDELYQASQRASAKSFQARADKESQI